MVKEALIQHEGLGGKLFQLILDYEHADWRKLKAHTAELNIRTNMIAQLYMDCVEEVNGIWEALSSEFERKEEEQEEAEDKSGSSDE